MGTPWTMEEIDIVEQAIAAGLSVAEICAKLPHRPKGGIENHLKRRRIALGLPDQRTVWTPVMLQMLTDGLDERRSYAEIAADVGLDKEAVRRKAKYLTRPASVDDGGGYWTPKRMISMDARFCGVMTNAIRSGKEHADIGVVTTASTEFPRSLPVPMQVSIGSPAGMCADAGE